MSLRPAWAAMIAGGCIMGLVGCGVSVEQKALNEAVGRWGRSGTTTYQHVQELSCFCEPEWTRAMRVEVSGGQVGNVIYVDDGSAVPDHVREGIRSIDEWFEIIQDALDRGAHAVHIEYDSEDGHPNSIDIDQDAQIVDEEISLEIKELVAVDGD